MKSFVAWSLDRQTRDNEIEQQNAADRQVETADCNAELDAIAAKLLDGVLLYGVMECATRQREILGGWVKDQSLMVRSTVEAQIQEVKHRLTHVVSQVVGPLISETLKTIAVEDVCALLESKFSSVLPQDTVVRVPHGMHALFVEELRKRGLPLVTEPGGDGDLTIQVADTLIETQMVPALQSLEKVLAP